MTRKRQVPEIRPIDEEAEKEEEKHYFRLDTEAETFVEQVVVKLEPEQPDVRKLQVPAREEIETRANEPNVDNLITVSEPNLEQLEVQWGKAMSERRPIPFGWFILLGVLLLGIATWAILHVRGAGEQIEAVRVETEQIIDSERKSVARATDQIEAIQRVLTAYGMAETVAEKAASVRHEDRVKPLMEQYYSRNPLRPHGRPRVDSLHPLTLGNQGQFWVAGVSFERSERLSLIIESMADGSARIDWETVVCYQPMAWDDYARQRQQGTTMDFRVYVRPDMLYSHEFQDASEWDCYQLTAHNSEEFLFGYVRKSDPTAEFLRHFFQVHGTRAAPMILRLSLPQGLESPRGVIIEEALSIRWIYVVPPTDNS